MFQINSKVKKGRKKELQLALLEFQQVIPNLKDIFNPDDTEWDLNKIYQPNFARGWNSPKNINSPCIIIAKDDIFALVQFKTEGNNTLSSSMYLLEDLSFL